MRVTNVQVEQFGSGSHPDGINADVELEGLTLEVYRSWDDPQWFIYDIAWDSVGLDSARIGDIDRKYPVAGEIVSALERAIDGIRGDYTPA
jgi:hypothetical protein